VRERCAFPTREDSREPAALLRELAVAYGIHTEMEAMKRPVRDEPRDRLSIEGERSERPQPDDSMLPLGERGEGVAQGCGHLVAPWTTGCPHPRHSLDAGRERVAAQHRFVTSP